MPLAVNIMAQREGESLQEEIVLAVLAQGFDSLDDLVSSQLTDQDFEDFFVTSRLLTAGQCQALKAIVSKHRGTAPSLPVAPRRQPESILQSYRYSAQDDSQNKHLPLQTEGFSSTRRNRYQLSSATARFPNDDSYATGARFGQSSTHRNRHQLSPSSPRLQDDYSDVAGVGFGHSSTHRNRHHLSPVSTRFRNDYSDVAGVGFAQSLAHRNRHHLGSATTRFRDDYSDAVYPGCENAVRLLLLGKTGSGKSTTGNTILGKRLFNTAPSFGSVTSVCERHVEIRGNARIEIMDSPGLYDTEKKHEVVCTTIIQAVAGMHPGPHALLFVIRVGRYTPEEHSAYGRLKAIFDDNVTKHMIIVFTHGDEVEREGTTLEALLTSPDVPDNLHQVLRECRQRCILFNNEAENKQPQVDKLLEMVRKLTAENRGKPYSCPKYSKIGEELVKEVNKRMAKFEEKELQRVKYVQDLEHQTKEAELRAAETRKEFERKEAERERKEKKEAERRRKLEEDLKNQQANFEVKKRRQQRHLDDLKQQMLRQQEQERKRMENQEKLSREQERKLHQEMEDMRRRERQMKEVAELQARQEEQRREAEREEFMRIEREKLMMQQQHEQQRRLDMEEMDRMNKEFELRMADQMKAEAEERQRKERAWQAEMNDLKNKVVKNKEPGFLSKVGSVLAAPFRAIKGWFS